MGAWVLGGFAESSAMVEAARKLRGEGYVLMDAFTPFPSDEAYEVIPGRPRIAPAVLIAGLAGVATGFFIQWFCNAVDYRIIVGGRPFMSLPTYVPICFECMVLFASFAGLYAFFIACKMPRLDHELQASALFERSTVDRFVLAIRWERPTDGAPLVHRLRELGADETDEVRDA